MRKESTTTIAGLVGLNLFHDLVQDRVQVFLQDNLAQVDEADGVRNLASSKN